MKRHFRISGIKLAALMVTMLFCGCASWNGVRFYSGEPLPEKEVAFIYLANKCQLGGITEVGKEKKNFLMWTSVAGEVMPGDYILELRYFYSGSYTKVKGNTVNLPLQARAGHVYYIKTEFPTPGTWRPVVLDIASDEDYGKIQNRNPKNICAKIEKYFQGERPPLQEREAKTSDGRVIKVWQ